MAFTYSASLTTNLSRVRFLLQDTTDTATRPAWLDDGEITWVLTTEANIYMAAAVLADLLATRFRGINSKKVGGLSITYGQAATEWSSIAAKLRARGSSHQQITAGGVLIADRDAIWENSDLLRPSFFSRLHEDPQNLPPARSSDTTEEEA